MAWFDDIQFFLGETTEVNHFVRRYDSRIRESCFDIILLSRAIGVNPDSVRKYINKLLEDAIKETKPRTNDHLSEGDLFSGESIALYQLKKKAEEADDLPI